MRDMMSGIERWLAENPSHPHAGWIAFHLQQARNSRDRGSPRATQDALKAYAVAQDINVTPLSKVRGKFRWAYLSAVDGTGQPFTVGIPDDYDPRTSYPLRIWLHGNGETHVDDFKPLKPHAKPYIFLRVLGRARAGGYVRLSEIDVLEAISFVRTHWNVDERRIWMSGPSMGGNGCFRLASRHPHLFAAIRPMSSAGIGMPLENLLHVPVFALHSLDDRMVRPRYTEEAIQEITRIGGTATFHTTRGYGHGITRWKEGIAESEAWEALQVRPDRPAHIRYTAVDELASRAYWARVVEWGPSGKPARFELRVLPKNSLYLETDNVGILAFDLTAAPVDRALPLTVTVVGKPRERAEAPLPDTLYVHFEENRASLRRQPPTPPPYRRHFPGGPAALYQGEPLMIVWGTTGDGATTNALKDSALVLATSVGARLDDRDVGSEYPKYSMLYGSIPAKADTDVSDVDQKRCNLLLLGTAEQNRIVAALSGRLSIRIENDRVIANDGKAWPFKDCELGLLHYNPSAPRRLVYWVASSIPTESPAGRRALFSGPWPGNDSDFVLVSARGEKSPNIKRNFRTDWTWEVEQ
jgi:hypothetical protein